MRVKAGVTTEEATESGVEATGWNSTTKASTNKVRCLFLNWHLMGLTAVFEVPPADEPEEIEEIEPPVELTAAKAQGQAQEDQLPGKGKKPKMSLREIISRARMSQSTCKFNASCCLYQTDRLPVADPSSTSAAAAGSGTNSGMNINRWRETVSPNASPATSDLELRSEVSVPSSGSTLSRATSLLPADSASAVGSTVSLNIIPPTPAGKGAAARSVTQVRRSLMKYLL